MVVRPDVHDVIRHGRRRLNRRADGGAPGRLAGRDVERVESPVHRSGEHQPVRHRRRRDDGAVRGEGPGQRSGGKVESIDRSVVRADDGTTEVPLLRPD